MIYKQAIAPYQELLIIVSIGFTMNALLRFVQDEYPDANNDQLAALARAIFDDDKAYLAEIDHLLNPNQTLND